MQIPEFIDIDTAIYIHDRQIEMFGGSYGIKDLGLLESALAQPQATFFGEYLHPDLATQASAYLFHIVKNHAFEDGNKRTALGVMLAFLGLNGFDVDFSTDELYELVLDVTTDIVSKEAAAKVIRSKLTE